MQTELPQFDIPGLGPLDPIALAILAGIFLFLALSAAKAFRRDPAAAKARAQGTHRAKACRWRKDRRGRQSLNTRWTCTACGVDAYSQDRRPPKECKRALRPASL